MTIKVADFSIRFTSGSSFFFDEGYLPFLVSAVDRPDATVVCKKGIPTTLFDGCETLFEAKSDTQRFYSVLKYGDSLGFILYNQQGSNDIQQMTVLDTTLSHWTIYSEPMEDGRLYPMKYPMGPILLYYLVVKNDAVMIHASGIFDGVKGRIFTGFSGTGKSTMAKQWLSCGSIVINDDRLIIRRVGDQYRMYNTPMYYADQPKSAPVDAVHLIRHFPENITQRIVGAKAVSKVMAFCIQNNFDKKFIQNYIGFLTGLCLSAGIYETGFVPDTDIVRYIQQHEE